mmetsp:Transcript_8848/g.11671  ORF Transcript_8848/g.11671 Transcript_8848/m.11671 type:complete len:151 (+) Transcript_8848:218-670(+)
MEETVWECEECMQENDADEANCIACEQPRPVVVDPRYEGIVVGLVVTLNPLKGKLKKLEVDVGEEEPLTIVTNAPNVREDSRVVVAKVGSVVNDEPVKKASVGGCMSYGMLCDAPMLGWVGGGAGTAALVPDTYEIGSPPPDSRPRMDKV